MKLESGFPRRRDHPRRHLDTVAELLDQEFEARLRFYLLLTCIPQVEGNCEYPPKGEPGLDEKQRPWLVETIADKWAKPLELAGDAATRSNMLAIAEAYIDIVATEPGYLFERNVRLGKTPYYALPTAMEVPTAEELIKRKA